MIKLENISFDHCIKCTVCTVYCPVARATHLFPGPKQSGPDAERLRIKNPDLVDDSLKYCSNCKRCEIACPSNVRIADIIQEAKFRHLKKKFRMRDFFMSRTDLVGGMATMFGFLVSFVIRLFPVKLVMDLVLKIPYQRSFPAYATGTFHRWAKKKMPDQSKFERKAVYFHGCYVNYNNHDLGKDVVRVLNAIGIGVEVTGEKCCGVPLIANGYLEKAKKNAVHNIGALGRAVAESEKRIVSASSTARSRSSTSTQTCSRSTPAPFSTAGITSRAFSATSSRRGMSPP
jgi:glycerol-3-phosphate dehydrogenase subunit C